MNEMVSSIIRHGLTTVGGSLVAKGLITATLWDQVTGAVIVLAGVGWSLVSKFIAKKTGLPTDGIVPPPAPTTPESK